MSFSCNDFFPILNCSKYSRKIRTKISMTEAFGTLKEGHGAPSSPFGIYYLFVAETLEENPASRNTSLFRRRPASKIGGTRRPLPGTLPEGGLTSGSFSTTMDASRM